MSSLQKNWRQSAWTRVFGGGTFPEQAAIACEFRFVRFVCDGYRRYLYYF